MLRIVPLADCPAQLPVLAELMRGIWPLTYGPDAPGDAMQDLLDRSRRTGIPYGLAAVDQAGHALGTVALSATVPGAESAEGPWLCGLMVPRPLRKRGIGSTLIAAAEEAAAAAGIARLFSATDVAADLFVGRGWEPVRRMEDGTAVFTLSL